MNGSYTRSVRYKPSRAAQLAVRGVGNVFGIWLADAFGLLSYGGKPLNLLLAALVLAVVNWLVRPIVTLLSLPAIILTLGLFIIVVSAIMLWLTSLLVSSFELFGFWHTVGAAIVVAVANAIVSALLRDSRQGQRADVTPYI